MTDRTPCRTPAGTSATNLRTWKFEACRTAILSALSDGAVAGRDIADHARDRMSEAHRADLGKLGWHVTAVRLELEVRGEIERVPGAKPVTLGSRGRIVEISPRRSRPCPPEIARPVDRARAGAAARADRRAEGCAPVLEPYIGHATPEGLVLRGRVLTPSAARGAGRAGLEVDQSAADGVAVRDRRGGGRGGARGRGARHER